MIIASSEDIAIKYFLVLIVEAIFEVKLLGSVFKESIFLVLYFERECIFLVFRREREYFSWLCFERVCNFLVSRLEREYFSFTARESYEEAVARLKKFREKHPKLPIMLLANKQDLENKRYVYYFYSIKRSY